MKEYLIGIAIVLSAIPGSLLIFVFLLISPILGKEKSKKLVKRAEKRLTKLLRKC